MLQRHYKLRASRHLGFFICSAAFLALWVLFRLPLDSISCSVLGLLIVALCARVFFRDARLSWANSGIALRLEAADEVVLILRDGQHVAGRRLAGSVILPFLVLLNIRLEQGGYRSLLLLQDSMDAASFRRLRVALRWGVKRQDGVSSV